MVTVFRLQSNNGLAAVSCSADVAMSGGVDRCIFVTGKPRCAWVGAWVHGMAPGVGGLALIVFGYLTL